MTGSTIRKIAERGIRLPIGRAANPFGVLLRLPRLPSVLILGGLFWLMLGDVAGAQESTSAWPPFPLPNDPKQFPRGPGGYISLWKMGFFLGLFLLWVKTTDWVNQDCQELRLNYGLWNSLVAGVFFACVLLLWLLPWFVVGYLLLMIGYVAPLTVYVLERNKKVPRDRQVMTLGHWRRMVAGLANKVGFKMDVEKKAAHELGPDVKLIAQGGANDQADQATIIAARQSPGYVPAKELIDSTHKMRAEQVMLEYTQAAVGVKYQIDGVWHNHNPLDRERGDAMLTVFKAISAMNPADRVKKQSGKFTAELRGQKLACRIQSQGTQTGEAAVIAFEQKKLAFSSLDELGMRGKMQEQIKEVIGRKSGFVLVSSMPGGGLTTTFDVLMSSTDRFMRNFVGVEDEAKHEREIENIPMTRFDSRKGETPMDVLPKLIRTYPDVYVLRDLVNGETVNTLCDQVSNEERFTFASIRAKEATEAMLRVLMLKADAEKFAKVITAVLNVRLVRKLCDSCKEAYAPPPEVLKQLGLPPGKVQALYRPPTPPPPDSDAAKHYKPCEDCMAIGYRGRTAIFELAMVDDRMRQILAKQPKLDLLRDASKKAGNRNLQEEGVLLVARGIASVPELVRVLKQ
jgi:type II secretory ATPase GspE/PulE/Tfp pilus assembly ATPase PilB-like protein